ncbi:hypothetical protein BGX28_008584 [Mortierella sp. GBA30]|nr:hypothetical protein BGX28_008584 [Mortierella sp. GBA30]
MSSNIKTAEDNSASFTGWASARTANLKTWSYHPRPLGLKDVEIAITHCGICGSDVHTITEGWGRLQLGPCIPGHEIVGKVVAKGDKCHHQIGDLVGAGPVIDSCGECRECKAGVDNFCRKRTNTYNDIYKDERGGKSYGGYANRVRANGDFFHKIPSEISAAEAASLLCAGITKYAPLKHYGAGPGKTVGVIGIGGLGHLGIQWASAMKCDQVVAISTSDSKREEAKKLGATKFINVKNPEEMNAAAASMNIILCTSCDTDQDWSLVLNLVATRGTFVMFAAPEAPMIVTPFALIPWEIKVAGSAAGSTKDMKEMFQFASKTMFMPMSDANAAVKHLMEGRPRYRIVMETELAYEI